nr:MAG TPA: hypothetical protein [Bacteriophage sp.]
MVTKESILRASKEVIAYACGLIPLFRLIVLRRVCRSFALSVNMRAYG